MTMKKVAAPKAAPKKPVKATAHPKADGFIPYAGADGSNVTGYKLAEDSITVQFRGGASYLYTDTSAGPEHITRMKAFAAAGSGLANYINTHVRKSYAEKHA